MEITDYRPIRLKRVLHIGSLISLHYFQYVQNFAGSEESHPFWEMVYVDFGEITVLADTQHRRLRQGEAIFHPPGEEHNIFTGERFASVFIISFTGPEEELRHLGGKILSFGSEEREKAAQLLSEGQAAFEPPYDRLGQKKLRRRQDAPFGAEQMILSTLEQLLILLIRDTSRPVPSRQATRLTEEGEKEIVSCGVNLLEKRVYDNLSLGEICEELSYSKSYLEEIFLRHTGEGVIRCYQRLRAREAQRLISLGEQSFTEIARCLGYSSIHHFSRAFKRATGMTPTGYARSVQSRRLL